MRLFFGALQRLAIIVFMSSVKFADSVGVRPCAIAGFFCAEDSAHCRKLERRFSTQVLAGTL
jgi:hypothetical protein